MTPSFTWKPTPGRFASGDTLYLGLIAVARTYTPMRTKGEPVRYAVEMRLPGFKHNNFDTMYDTADAAKARAEAAVKTWLIWIGAD